MRGFRGGGLGVRSPPENHKNIGYLKITGPDPLKITKLPSQHSMLGYHWHADDGPHKVVFGSRPSSTKNENTLDPL